MSKFYRCHLGLLVRFIACFLTFHILFLLLKPSFVIRDTCQVQPKPGASHFLIIYIKSRSDGSNRFDCSASALAGFLHLILTYFRLELTQSPEWISSRKHVKTVIDRKVRVWVYWGVKGLLPKAFSPTMKL